MPPSCFTNTVEMSERPWFAFLWLLARMNRAIRSQAACVSSFVNCPFPFLSICPLFLFCWFIGNSLESGDSNPLLVCLFILFVTSARHSAQSLMGTEEITTTWQMGSGSCWCAFTFGREQGKCLLKKNSLITRDRNGPTYPGKQSPQMASLVTEQLAFWKRFTAAHSRHGLHFWKPQSSLNLCGRHAMHWASSP